MLKQLQISYFVFGITFTVVIVHVFSLFFPAFLVISTSGLESNVEPFEPGAWSLPLSITFVLLSSLGYFYYIGLNPIKKSINRLLNFEISKKVSTITIVIILTIYISLTIEELTLFEGDQWLDYFRIQKALENYPYGEEGAASLRALHVKNFFLYSSQEILQNIKIIPFIASIALLLLTYFFTAMISKKRFAGIVAMVILLQSSTFLRYDTIAAYSNFWVLFYLLSLYVIFKKWYFSPIALVLSFFSKMLSIVFIPLTMFLIYRATIPKKKKIFTMISYFALVAIVLGYILSSGLVDSETITVDYIDFLTGIATFASHLRFDSILVLFILPLVVGLFLISIKGNPQADFISILIMGTLFSASLLVGFSEYNLQPYRYMPLIVFFSVGVGMIFSRRSLNRD